MTFSEFNSERPSIVVHRNRSSTASSSISSRLCMQPYESWRLFCYEEEERKKSLMAAGPCDDDGVFDELPITIKSKSMVSDTSPAGAATELYKTLSEAAQASLRPFADDSVDGPSSISSTTEGGELENELDDAGIGSSYHDRSLKLAIPRVITIHRAVEIIGEEKTTAEGCRNEIFAKTNKHRYQGNTHEATARLAPETMLLTVIKKGNASRKQHRRAAHQDFDEGFLLTLTERLILPISE